MKIEYRKIFNKNYAVISDYNISDYKECYRSKMLKSNKLDYFLTYDTQSINGTIHFTYDISSKQSIHSFYENSDINYETIRHLIMSLKAAFDTLNNYLLEPDYIVLDPKIIYMNIATKALYFCYCPGEKNNFYESLNTLICYILSKINHEDTNCIILAYSLQQQSINANYTFDDLMEILNKQVFNHQNSHINQTEQIQKNQKADICDNNIYKNESEPPVISDYSKSESFSDISKHFSKRNSKRPGIIPVCILVTILTAILYYGMVLRAISTELMIILSCAASFLCFELLTYFKNKQSAKQKATSKLSKSDSSFYSKATKDSFEENTYSDTGNNQTKKTSTDTCIKNYPTEHNFHKDDLWKNYLKRNRSKKNCSTENDIIRSQSIENNITGTYLTENDIDENYLIENNIIGSYSIENNSTESYPIKNDLGQIYSTEQDSLKNHLSKSYSTEQDSEKNYFQKNCSKKNYYEDTIILGYRSSESLPRLVYTGTDFTSENELVSFPFIIGKMTDNVNMVIDNPMISRIHAKIYLKEGHYYIEDMNSSNGTYINNNLIQPHSLTEINTGDYITFSHLTYIFQ